MKIIREPRQTLALRLGAALWLLWPLFPASLSAQATRTDSIAEAQAAKAQHLGVEGPSFGERVFVRVTAFDTAGVFPWVGSVYPGTGAGVGIGAIKHWGRTTDVNLLGGVSTGNASFVEMAARSAGMARGHLDASLVARHTRLNDLEFFGLGPAAPRAGPLDYDYHLTSITGSLRYHPARWLEFSGAYQHLIPRAEADAPVTPAPGFGVDLTYNVVSLGALIDWRTSPSYSTRGGSQRITWWQYLPTQERPFGFQQVEYEGTQFMPLLNEQYVLAFRALATLTTASSGDTVPAVLSPTLGGATTLRGYETRRFTDRNRLLLSGEYRWRPSRWIDLALFADAGKVAPNHQDLGFSNLETDWGGGLRFHGYTEGGFRLEMAKGREGWEAMLTAGSPF